MSEEHKTFAELFNEIEKSNEKLQEIFALVEAHRTEQHYRRSHADLRLWEAVLGLKSQ